MVNICHLSHLDFCCNSYFTSSDMSDCCSINDVHHNSQITGKTKNGYNEFFALLCFFDSVENGVTVPH